MQGTYLYISKMPAILFRERRNETAMARRNKHRGYTTALARPRRGIRIPGQIRQQAVNKAEYTMSAKGYAALEMKGLIKIRQRIMLNIEYYFK